jgi:hypothetical protein
MKELPTVELTGLILLPDQSVAGQRTLLPLARFFIQAQTKRLARGLAM